MKMFGELGRGVTTSALGRMVLPWSFSHHLAVVVVNAKQPRDLELSKKIYS